MSLPRDPQSNASPPANARPRDADRDLVRFLQQHRPDAPPATEALSDRILAQIECLDIDPAPPRLSPVSMHRRLRWVVPPAIAAATIVGWLSVRPLAQVADVADVEAAMISSWQVTTEGPDDGESFAFFAFDPADEF